MTPTREDFAELSPADFMDKVEAEGDERQRRESDGDLPTNVPDDVLRAQWRADRKRFWLWIVVIWLIVFSAIVVGYRPARAHSFYSAACCSGRDCTPAALGDVTWTPAGYRVLSTNEVIPLDDKRIQFSPPGEPGFRLCVPPYDGKVRCLYVPEPEG